MTESTEEGRAFLQYRVALFWKVMFGLCMIGSVLGGIGALATPGVDYLITLGLTVQAGVSWWLASRGNRSVAFSRRVESISLMVNTAASAVLWRYLLAGFARDHAVESAQGLVLADAYLAMFQMGGSAMMVAIRAAVIPSAPRRTVVLTTAVGVPLVLATTLLVAGPSGRLTWRALDFETYAWMPLTQTVLWSVAVITCTVISSVIYGLRAEVREARQLGQYVLEEKIGEGGMGEVYRARHGMMRRPTALKLIRVDRAGDQGVQRFEREVQLTARLTHPNTITIYDYGRTQDGIFYYAMELLEGANLQRIVALDGPQPPARVVRILSMVAAALNEAHAIGLIHRDIKPANIMLCTQGGEFDVVKLLDFGLVKDIEMAGDVELTMANTLAGTPAYMSPESFVSPGAVDARADLYAVGAVGYFLLAGRPVFEGTSILKLYSQHVHESPAPLAARGLRVPEMLDALIMSCLEKDPARRPQSAVELRGRLESCGVQPWDSEQAGAWWAAHREKLQRHAPAAARGALTIEVNRGVDVRA